MEQKLDSELIEQSRAGDHDAIAELLERHYPSMIRLARGILRSNEESQDVVQVACFSAYRHLDKFRGDSSFKTWISRIVVNSCLMQLREPGRRVGWVNVDDLHGMRGTDPLICPAPTPEETVWRHEIRSALSDAVSRLPKQLREVYLLHSDAGLSLKEVAASLGLTVAATKTRLFRARHRMRKRLQPAWRGRPAVLRRKEHRLAR